MKTAGEIQEWLTAQVASILGMAADEVDPDDTFDAFGLASRDAVSLSGDLEDYLERRLSPTLLYQYPTIRQLAEHLAGDGKPIARQTPATIGAGAPSADPATADMTEDEAEIALLRKLLELDE